MVKYKDWDEFSLKGWEVAADSPHNTRWLLKWSTKKKEFKVKVTSGSKSYTYRLSNFEAEFNKVKQFSLTMTRLLTHSEENKKPKKKHRSRQ